MIVVIQCAAGKDKNAGHLHTLDGRKVVFVANPDFAPTGGNTIYARPDDLSDSEKPWRTVLLEYNDNPAHNPLGLLPAWQLYRNPAYKILAEHCGLQRLYILSAGWGLISAGFLTPNYDITFNKAQNVQPFKRRSRRENYCDFSMLPTNVVEPVLFFGCRDYIALFCKLTEVISSRRTVFYAGGQPNAPGCSLRRYGKPFMNWHYQCAKAFVEGTIRLNDG